MMGHMRLCSHFRQPAIEEVAQGEYQNWLRGPFHQPSGGRSQRNANGKQRAQRLACFLTPAGPQDDRRRYVWDGRMQRLGYNPYTANTYYRMVDIDGQTSPMGLLWGMYGDVEGLQLLWPGSAVARHRTTGRMLAEDASTAFRYRCFKV